MGAGPPRYRCVVQACSEGMRVQHGVAAGFRVRCKRAGRPVGRSEAALAGGAHMGRAADRLLCCRTPIEVSGSCAEGAGRRGGGGIPQRQLGLSAAGRGFCGRHACSSAGNVGECSEGGRPCVAQANLPAPGLSQYSNPACRRGGCSSCTCLACNGCRRGCSSSVAHMCRAAGRASCSPGAQAAMQVRSREAVAGGGSGANHRRLIVAAFNPARLCDRPERYGALQSSPDALALQAPLAARWRFSSPPTHLCALRSHTPTCGAIAKPSRPLNREAADRPLARAAPRPSGSLQQPWRGSPRSAWRWPPWVAPLGLRPPSPSR